MIAFVTVFALFLTLFGVYNIRRRRTLKGKIIPGPKFWPFLGCMLDINNDNMCEKFTELSEKFGEIFRVRKGPENIVSLNSEELIRKAFSAEKYKRFMNDKGELFYGKYFRCDHETVGFAIEGYGTFHKIAGKAFTQAMYKYEYSIPDAEEKSLNEMNRLIQTIENFQGKGFDCMELFQRSLTNIITLLLCGETMCDGDPDVNVFWEHAGGDEIFLDSDVNNVLSTFPFLRYLPGKHGDSFRRIKKVNYKIAKRFVRNMKRTSVPGKFRGFVDYYLDDQRKEMDAGDDVFFTDERIVGQLVETTDSAIVTIWSFLGNTMLVLLNHPEYQAKIQDELDREVGHSRVPRLEDRENCPFLRAFEMEMHRYITVAPFLLPHACRHHIEFEGYDIEENSTIIANVWFMHHNQKIWGDPWTFRPERFLDKTGQLLPADHILCKNLLPLGYGRRQCKGESFAKSRFFLYMATLLQHFSFQFMPGEARSCDPRSPDVFEMTVTLHPKPFKCCAIKRHKCTTL